MLIIGRTLWFMIDALLSLYFMHLKCSFVDLVFLVPTLNLCMKWIHMRQFLISFIDEHFLWICVWFTMLYGCLNHHSIYVSHGRSLLSFDGEYLKHDCCRLTSRGTFGCVKNGAPTFDSHHEVFRINITQTKPDTHGPGFVEVSEVCYKTNRIPPYFRVWCILTTFFLVASI